MSKKPLDITLFNKGLISSADPEDIDINAMSYSENLDANIDGKLQGIPESTVFSSTLGLGYINGEFIKRLTGQYDLVYTNGTNIYVIYDFYGTPSQSTILTGANGKTFLKEGRHIYIGVGNTASAFTQWVGYVEQEPFGGIGQVSYSGSGLNDANICGSYTGSTSSTYYVKISATGANDSFEWKKDSGSWSAAISIGASYTIYALAEGLSVLFDDITGHSTSDNWSFSVKPVSTSTMLSFSTVLSTYEQSGSVNGLITLSGGRGGTGGGQYYWHRYRYSLVYVGTNESPLSAQYIDAFTLVNSNYDDSIWLAIKNGAASLSSIDARLTAINIYVATNSIIGAQPPGSLSTLGEYQLIDSVSLNVVGNNNIYYNSVLNTDFFYPATGINYVQGVGGITFNNVGADMAWELPTGLAPGVTYEVNTGIPEDAEAVTLNYNLSAFANSSAFIADAYENSLSSNRNMFLFKSKSGSLGMFDIVNDSLWLGFVPLGMVGFNSKLYIWDAYNTYVINPDGLFVEDTIPGIGLSNALSVRVTEFEQFHALIWNDKNNIYMTSGQGIQAIGDPIKKAVETVSVDWQSMVSSTRVIFDAIKQLALVYCVNGSGVSEVFAYHIVKKRWDYFPNFAGATITGAFTGIEGETYSVTSTKVYFNFNSTTFNSWTYVSPELTFDNVSQNKMFYNLIQDGVLTVTPYYSTDRGITWYSLTNDSSSKPTLIQSSGVWVFAKSLRIKLVGSSGSVMNALTIIYRAMIGTIKW